MLKIAKEGSQCRVELFQVNRLNTLFSALVKEQLKEQGHLTESLATLVKALRIDAEDPIVHHDIGVVLTALGQSDKAQQSFERATLLAPGLRPPSPKAQGPLVTPSPSGRGPG